MHMRIDGNKVFCREWIPATPVTAPQLVLLHGALHDHAVWEPVARTLARRGLRVLAPDLPGHGASSGAALPSIEAMAIWLDQVVQKAACTSVLAVGHSMGSLIALEWAALASRSVPLAALVLLGTAAPMHVSPALLELARAAPLEAAALIADWSHPPLAPGEVVAPHAEPRAVTLAMLRQVAARAARDLLATDLQACHNYERAVAACGQLECPVWIVCGQYDRMTPPRTADAIAAGLKHGKIHVLDSGHGMLVEQPAAVAALLSQCVAGLAPA
jgi:pimeloyl-ACP methyl ester carboxylesterase